MRFKTDENLHPEVTEFLRSHGHDAVTVWDQAMRGASDSDLAQVCQNENRVLVTLDQDFGDIRTYPPSKYSGIVVLSLHRQDRVWVLSVFQRLLPRLQSDFEPGKLWVVDETRVRIRGDDAGP